MFLYNLVEMIGFALNLILGELFVTVNAFLRHCLNSGIPPNDSKLEVLVYTFFFCVGITLPTAKEAVYEFFKKHYFL